MPKTPPTWYEALLGTALMAVTLAASWRLIQSDDEVSVYVWAGIGTVFALGAWAVIPYRATQLLEEIRGTVIWWRKGHRGE